MTSNILSAPPSEDVGQYRLSQEKREAILAQSPSAKRLQKIERQRLAFIKKFGSEFGTDDAEQP